MRSLTVKILPSTFLVGVILSCGGGGASNQQPQTPPPHGSDGSYYIDCSVPTNGNGTQASPWNTLSSVNVLTLSPGSQVLLKRGMTCQGTLNPRGSGSSTAPIIIDAYGSGAQPIIDGGMNDAAITLMDQQYWEIRNLEILGGNKFGIFIGGSTSGSTLNHFHLINLNVHGAHYTSTTPYDSGEIYISPAGIHQVLNDVLIDGVSAHDSQVWDGMFVEAGGDFNSAQTACQQQPTPAQDLGTNITIQNSTAHDLFGDGILVLQLRSALIQDNVVFNTGLATNPANSSTGLWEWCCHSCTLQNNESYANHTASPLFDGGDFDIDVFNNDNIWQYNYGHDSDGYCILFFGDPSAASTDNIFRYNICSNNAQSGAVVSAQGEVLVEGAVNGVQIYNNTISANALANAGIFNVRSNTIYGGSDPRFFENNIIYSAVPVLIEATSAFTLDNNIYWTTSGSPPSWQWNGVTYTDVGAYQAGSGQDAHSYYADPMLNDPTYHTAGRSSSAFTLQTGSPARGTGTNVCLGISGCSMGTQDFFGNPLPNGSGYDIGADQAP